VVTPMDSLRRHGSDAVRYWAASGRLGVDMTFDPAQLKVGRRLAVKILNASRFVLSVAPDDGAAAGGEPLAAVTEPLDTALLGRLAEVITSCTRSFDDYDHAGALAAAEDFFWFFCDDYLELVKDRAYGERGAAPAASARATLRLALSVVLRLFAPFLPFATEEAWSWWQHGSVHRAAWPVPAEVRAAAGAAGPAVLTAASSAIAAIRGAKSGARISMRAPVRALVVTARPAHLAAVRAVLADVTAAGRVEHTELRAGEQDTPVYEVELAAERSA
jgi:valyl-tRNA synthetase